MNIIILNPYNKFPGSSRWDFELISYEQFIDHQQHQVTYIADQRGLSGITANSAEYQLINIVDFSNTRDLIRLMEQEITRLGKVDRIIAFSESHMDVAAQMREKYAIPGPGIAETERARDKVVMKQHIHAANLRAPYYISVAVGSQLTDIQPFINKIGYPLILKPTDGASSVGVEKIEDEATLVDALSQLSGDNWELEEFIEGDVLHIDGLIDAQGDIIFSVPSRYINTLFDYLRGMPTGSILLSADDPLYHAANLFSAQCLKALAFTACPFHLELIVSKDNELVFLENAARVAGADIPYMIADCLGVNLFKGWVEMIMGQPATITKQAHQAGAWLLFGLPEQLPCKVAAVTRFKHSTASLYKELVPEIGSVVDKQRGYCSLQAGRFMFKSDTQQQLMADVNHVLDNFEFNSVAL